MVMGKGSGMRFERARDQVNLGMVEDREEGKGGKEGEQRVDEVVESRIYDEWEHRTYMHSVDGNMNWQSLW